MRIKKITFIRPNMGDWRASDAMEPLVFAILASRTPSRIQCVLYDERLEPIPEDDRTDLVAITVETFTARRAYEIASNYRRRGIPVVMGGHHPTMLPQEALRYCDAVVIGDGEGLWEQVVEDVEHHRLRPIYRRDGQADLRGLTPDRGIFSGKSYAPMALVQFGRGCRFACDFCSIHAFYGTYRGQRPVADVVDEIKGLNGSMVVFVDDNIYSNTAKFEELLRALIPLRIRWACQITIDVAANDRLLDLMAESGCIVALLGFESLQPENLRQMKKRWNLGNGPYEEVIRKFHDRNIMIYGTFVFGYDLDTPEAFDMTARFAMQSNLFLANFNPLTPMPGTALYDRLRAEKRMLHEQWWLDPDYRYGMAIFQPRGMSPTDLSEGCMRARGTFYGYGSVLKRAFHTFLFQKSWRSLMLFLLTNTISRREIRRKQDTPLGKSGTFDLAGGR